MKRIFPAHQFGKSEAARRILRAFTKANPDAVVAHFEHGEFRIEKPVSGTVLPRKRIEHKP